MQREIYQSEPAKPITKRFGVQASNGDSHSQLNVFPGFMCRILREGLRAQYTRLKDINVSNRVSVFHRVFHNHQFIRLIVVSVPQFKELDKNLIDTILKTQINSITGILFHHLLTGMVTQGHQENSLQSMKP